MVSAQFESTSAARCAASPAISNRTEPTAAFTASPRAAGIIEAGGPTGFHGMAKSWT
jgi:hypothetical protein